MFRKSLSLLVNPLLIIGIAVLLRVMPHWPNFAPIAAMALFGGAYLNKKYALAIPLLAMLVSDLIIGFHDTMPYVYGSFLLVGLIGLWLQKHKSVRNTFAAALGSSLLFFVVTNFGVWLSGWYPQNLTGLMTTYIAAIPFFRSTLIGDLFYTALFFGGYELVKTAYAKVAVAKVTSVK